MLAGSRSNGSQAAIIVSLFFLLRSFHIGPREIEHTTRSSLQAVSHFTPNVWNTRLPPKVTKVTANVGQRIELFEDAIRSHEEHNRLHGYGLEVLRERIVGNYWNRPAYLLSLLVAELAKPVEKRTEWLMWFGPDVILLNPQIPLEVFLPPPDFPDTHFLATHDANGLECGVFFMRVNKWSVRMLIDVISLPKDHPALLVAENKDQRSFEVVLTSDVFREHVLYQPRMWYNGYQLSRNIFEGEPGDLLVHFHNSEGDKWKAMDQTLAALASKNSPWSVPLEETSYGREVSEYWDRLRRARGYLNEASYKPLTETLDGAIKRVQWALNYETDMAENMDQAIDALKHGLQGRQ